MADSCGSLARTSQLRDGEDTDLRGATVGQRPLDLVANPQTEQRGTDRRQDREPSRRSIRTGLIDKHRLANGSSTDLLERLLRVHPDAVGRQLRAADDGCAIEL